MDQQYLSVIDEKAALLEDVANYLWDNPETAFTEYKSAAYLCDVLRKEGFTVQENLAGIQTAFSGTYGSGKPVIGILGEFDALSGLSQEAGCLEQKSIGGEAGHGCGHHLFAAGSLGAAIAVKKWLETTGSSGTVVFFGTPGEEGGSGKSFMARDGVFDGLDAAFTWHPGYANKLWTDRSLANYQVLYKFDGVPSHASNRPDVGRSALDAVELMNVGVQFLREHMPNYCRVHYAITDAGGMSPNVVQAHAEVLYLIRGADNATVKELYQRVNDIAKGAALMTSTKESHVFIKACSNLVHNTVLRKVMHDKLTEIGVPELDDQELETAKRFSETALEGIAGVDANDPVWEEIWDYTENEVQGYSSTDVGDVSWVCPTAQILTATFARGTPPHTWQMVAQGKLPQAHKMTRYAAKVMAASAVEMISSPDLLAKAQEEFRSRVGAGYDAPIPKDVFPKAMGSFKK
ncbi:MAG: amidohydrolase [Oscillospiraceae bacterium]|nr:amidohydrolase [Oscillospiraceae bacterium]